MKNCLTRMLPAAAMAAAMTSASADTLYVTADRMIDAERGRLIENAAVIVDGDRVIAAGQAADVDAPADATRIPLGDMTLLPGLIDMHVHLTGNSDDQGYRGLAVSLPRETINGVANAKKTLMAGFTTVRNVGARGYSDIALRDAIAEGDIPGPRMFVSGPPVGITGGHCSDGNLLPPEFNAQGEGVANGPWEMRAKVRRNIKYGVDVIKTCSTGGVLSKGTEVGAPQTTLEELTAIADEAHMHGRKVASHAHGATGIKNALNAGIDTIEHASFIDDEGIRLARRTGAYLNMDIYVTEFILGEGEAAGFLPESLEKERRTGETQRENFRKAVEAGVNMSFGTDAGVYPHGHNARQLSRMVRFGMTPMQAIQAATWNSANALGAEADLGAISAGRYADMIAVPGNVLDDVSVLENVPFIMKGGKVYKDER
ncbi:MAG: amidohydrolase family protein [Parvularculaceae bacterium]